jgi:hypothetical protein
MPGSTTLVCEVCGNDRTFTGEAPTRLVCACGSTVWRVFGTPDARDDVARDFLDSTARSAALGDASPGTKPSDFRERNL